MSIARHHVEWLRLVPNSGPFLSLPVLLEAFPQGLDAHDADVFRALRLAFEEWEDSFQKKREDSSIHYAWIKFVLTKILEFDESLLAEGQAIPQTLHVDIAEHGELLKPDWVLNDPATKKARLLIQSYPPTQNLSNYVAGSRWKASPDTRMTELLHGTGVRLGLVTNGEHWMIVNAPKGETSGFASWYASLWREEKITLQAFRSLMSMTRFFGVADDKTIESLLAKSGSNQQEVTDQLGYQVRRAVEVLVQSLDRADQDHDRALLAGVGEAFVYESALTVMMRLVFLFCAEERELIPTKPYPVYEQNYSVSMISKQLRDIADKQGEELLERRFDAWPRLLTAFRCVYGGVRHDDVHIPAYGGRLFDPDRFPFLEGRKLGTSWTSTESNPLPVNNRTVLHLLEALQRLEVKVPGGGPAESRHLSFQALDIEQIGHVYEGLLDHTAKRAEEPYLGLVGSKGNEPEILLTELERYREKGVKALVDYVKEQTGRQPKSIEKALTVELDPQLAARFRTVCQTEALYQRVLPFVGLIRIDTFGYPVVIPKGSIFVTKGTDRRSSGTHYTPRSLTEPIVQYTLEPLVYVGPAEGTPKTDWKLKSAAELLDLKICDMACGSGAFLVQAARYMSERLLEAWETARLANPDAPGITPEGKPSTGAATELLIPDDPAERTIFAMRIIAQRCLYGVDINPLAAEMAKLSLWLLTLAKDKPFEFLDHAIRCGDSLVGIHDIKQLKDYSLKDDNKIIFEWPGEFEEPVDAAINLRLRLEDMPANTVEDIEAQEKLLEEADEQIARLRCAADLLVASEFWGENAKDKLERVRHAAVVTGHYVEKGPTKEFEKLAAKERRGQKMFHWPLEFPEVIIKRGGFDAFICNPPFTGGLKISAELGQPYLGWLKTRWNHAKGRADFVAYFLLQTCDCLNSNGTSGLVATKSLSQAGSKTVGLEYLLENGFKLYQVETNKPWPGAAGVHICVVHITRRMWEGDIKLDGNEVDRIGPSFDKGETVLVNKLKTIPIEPSMGLTLMGQGFLLTPQEAANFIALSDDNRAAIRPYLNGEVFNNSPSQSADMFCIDFHEWPAEECQLKYPALWKRVVELVKPFREQPRQQSHEDRFWVFEERRAQLHKDMGESQRCLVTSLVSKHRAFAFVNTDQVLSTSLGVFPTASYAVFAVMQSEVHFSWVLRQQYSLKGDPRYSLGDCFKTFCFPPGFDSAGKPCFQHTLEGPGERLHSKRGNITLDRQEGLTKTYNRFHCPDETSADIQTLRELHVGMDHSVLCAYGWRDLDLGHDFHPTKQGVRYTISEIARREVLQRLLNLNHERYAEEVKQGLHKKGAKKSNSQVGSAAKPKKQPEPMLFDIDGDE